MVDSAPVYDPEQPNDIRPRFETNRDDDSDDSEDSLQPIREGEAAPQASKGGKSGKKESLSSKALQAVEAGTTAAAGAPSGSADVVGRGFTGGEIAKTGKLAALITDPGKRKKTLAAGGGVGAVVAIIIFGIGAIVPYELVHIAKVLRKDQSKIEQRFEKKGAKSIATKLVCRYSPSSPRCVKDSATPEERAAAAEQAKADGRALSEEMNSFDLQGQASELERTGFKPTFDPEGNLLSLKNLSGEEILGNISDADFALLEEALPEWDVGQLKSYRPVNVEQAGVSYQGWTDTANDNVDETLAKKVQQGATNEEIQAASVEEGQNNDPNAAKDPANPPGPSNDTAAQEAANGPLADAINATEENFAKNHDATAAQAAGEAAFSKDITGEALLATGVATMACNVEKTVKEASDARVPQIITLLIRHGNLVLTLASQLQEGKVTSKEVNDTMKIVNGNPGLLANSDGTPQEGSMPFSSSAAWHRASGLPVDTNPKLGGKSNPAYTPDINPAALPTRKSGQKIVDTVDSTLSSVGGKATCKALTSPAGIIIQGAAGIGQIVADIGSFGATQIAITGGFIAFQELVSRVLLPQILPYFTSIAVSGTENAVQWLNNSHAGLDLSYDNYGRRVGAVPQTAGQANALALAADKDQAVQLARQPWATRTFGIDNPNSLTWHMMGHMPIGLQSNVASFTTYLTGFPATLMHMFASIFSPHSFAQANNDPNTSACGDPYCITKYAFSDSEVAKYDPLDNEQYLFGTVTAGGKTARRIDMLGNPNTYIDSPTGDPNSNDLMHCFVNSYKQFSNTNDPYCGSVGKYDFEHDGVVIPDDNTAVSVYCQALVGNSSDNTCRSQVASQVSDEVTHFRQYLLDTHVMSDYVSLTNET